MNNVRTSTTSGQAVRQHLSRSLFLMIIATAMIISYTALRAVFGDTAQIIACVVVASFFIGSMFVKNKRR